jgi:hypothetical protein
MPSFLYLLKDSSYDCNSDLSKLASCRPPIWTAYRVWGRVWSAPETAGAPQSHFLPMTKTQTQ